MISHLPLVSDPLDVGAASRHKVLFKNGQVWDFAESAVCSAKPSFRMFYTLAVDFAAMPEGPAVQELVQSFWDKLTLELRDDNTCISEAMRDDFTVILDQVRVAKVLYSFTKDVDETIYLCRNEARWLSGHEAFVDFLYVWGYGGSGKDFFWSLLAALFGDGDDNYAVGETGEFMIQMKATSKEGPSPTLMSWMGKRLLCFTEMPQQPLDLDALKPLTEQRGVKKKGRKLYQGPQAFHPTFGLLATSQWPASINAADDTGAARRMKMWMTTQIFKSKPDLNNPSEHLADDDLHRDVLKGVLALSLFHLVAPAYQTLSPLICKRGEILPIPPRIAEDTEKIFTAVGGFDFTGWLTTKTLWVPRAEATVGTVLVDKLVKDTGMEMRTVKQELVKIGVVSTGNGKDRIYVWRHPTWVKETKALTGAPPPGLQLMP